MTPSPPGANPLTVAAVRRHRHRALPHPSRPAMTRRVRGGGGGAADGTIGRVSAAETVWSPANGRTIGLPCMVAARCVEGVRFGDRSQRLQGAALDGHQREGRLEVAARRLGPRRRPPWRSCWAGGSRTG